GLYELTGGGWGGVWGTFICAIIVACFTLFVVTRKKQFTFLEYFARVASILMIGAFVYALFQIGHFDVAGFFRGMAFEMPPNDGGGAFAPIVIGLRLLAQLRATCQTFSTQDSCETRVGLA